MRTLIGFCTVLTSVLLTVPGCIWELCKGTEVQSRDDYYLIYVAEKGNSRSLTPINPDGSAYSGFEAPNLPGRYFNGITSSRDGNRLAFMRDIEGIDRYSLWRMYADGTGLKRLTEKGKRGLYPSLSSDGTRLAFTRQDRGVWEIYTIDFDGNNLKKLTSFRSQQLRPHWGMRTSWSPDGKRIAYSVSFGNSSQYEIYIMDADGSNVQRITNNDFLDKNPDFSPDGKSLAFNSNRNGKTRETFVLNLETGDIRGLGNVASAFGLDWSPDGKKIAFCGAAKGGSDIYIMNADGTNQVRLTTSSGLDMSPAWVRVK